MVRDCVEQSGSDLEIDTPWTRASASASYCRSQGAARARMKRWIECCTAATPNGCYDNTLQKEVKQMPPCFR